MPPGIVTVLIVGMMGITATLYGQTGNPDTRKPEFTLGLNVNPWLSVASGTPEVGPTFTYLYPVKKRFETGVTLFSRQQFGNRKSDLGTVRNVKTTINLETVLMSSIAIVFGKKNVKNKVLAFVGLRHDYYKERLKNETYFIDESYQYNEINFLYGLGYQFQYLLKSGNGLSFRLLVPTNRHPFDDVNRYSVEIGYTIKLNPSSRNSFADY